MAKSTKKDATIDEQPTLLDPNSPEETAVVVVTVEELVAPENEASVRIVISKEDVLQLSKDLAEKWHGFTAEQLTTKEKVEELANDLRHCVKLRTTVDKRRLAINRQTNDESKEILAWFAPIEKLLQTVNDAYKATEAKKAEDLRVARANRYNANKALLSAIKDANGLPMVTWGGSFYQLGMVTCEDSDLYLEDFGLILEKFKAAKKESDEKAEATRKENERLENERKEKEQRDAAQLAQMQNMVITARKPALVALGAVGQYEIAGNVVSKETEGAQFGYRLGVFFVGRADILEDEAEWEELLKFLEAERDLLKQNATVKTEAAAVPPSVEEKPVAAAEPAPVVEKPAAVTSPPATVPQSPATPVQNLLVEISAPAAPPKFEAVRFGDIGQNLDAVAMFFSGWFAAAQAAGYEFGDVADENRIYLSGAAEFFKCAANDTNREKLKAVWLKMKADNGY